MQQFRLGAAAVAFAFLSSSCAILEDLDPAAVSGALSGMSGGASNRNPLDGAYERSNAQYQQNLARAQAADAERRQQEQIAAQNRARVAAQQRQAEQQQLTQRQAQQRMTQQQQQQPHRPPQPHSVAQQTQQRPPQPLPVAQQQPKSSATTLPMAPTPVALATDKPAKPAPQIIDFREGVVVCPPGATKGDHWCEGPFQTAYVTLGGKSEHGEVGQACGSSRGEIRDLGVYGGRRVFGCGFGINPNKSDWPNRDIAAKYTLVIPSRRSYRCEETKNGYCMTQ